MVAGGCLFLHGRFSTAFFAFGFETDAQTSVFLHGGFVESCRLRNALSSRLVRITTDEPAKTVWAVCYLTNWFVFPRMDSKRRAGWNVIMLTVATRLNLSRGWVPFSILHPRQITVACPYYLDTNAVPSSRFKGSGNAMSRTCPEIVPVRPMSFLQEI